MDHDIAALKKQLIELASMLEAGQLTPEQYEQDKASLERRILDCVMSAPTVLPEQPVIDQSVTSVAAEMPSSSAGVAAPRRGPAKWLIAAFVALVVALLAVAYLSSRRVESKASAAAKLGAPTAAASSPNHDAGSEQMGAMIDKLAARLKDKPDDAPGWAMLARSYGALGRSADAVQAYAKATELSPKDAGLLVDYADVLAVKNNRSLSGEPMKLIGRALKLDPRNIKALAMAGSDAFERKDYRAAVTYWEQLVAIGGATNPFAQQIEPALVQARQLAGLPPGAPAASSSAAAAARLALPASAAAASAPRAGVQGTVTLAPSLRSQVKADDTVFIFARAAQGSRMPLAILRRQVKDLPIVFSLEDGMAMTQAPTLSTAGLVTVGARISRSGKAIAEKGDLFGQSDEVTVGVKGLLIEIKDTVK